MNSLIGEDVRGDYSLRDRQLGVVILLVVAIVAGFVRALRRIVNIPVVAVVVAIGFVAGRMVSTYDLKEKLLPVTDAQIRELLFLYLPVLMFTSAFNLRHHLFKQCFWQCVLLGCGGLAFSTMLFMLYMSGTRDAEQQNLAETVLISLLTCCAEPMFVSDLDVLSSARSHILETIIMGEPLVGVTCLWMAYRFSTFPGKLTIYSFFNTVVCTLFVGPIFGKVFGRVLAMATIALSQDLPVSFIVNVTSVIATWAFAEKFLYGAGITTIVSMGLTASAHSAATVHNPVVLRKFWMLVRYGYNVVIVFLSAYRIGRDTRQHLGWHEIMSPINAYVAKIGVRFVTTIVLYPLLASVGYDLSWQQCLIVAWANFKGAIMIGLDLTRAFPTINLAFALKEQFIRMGTLFLVQLLNTTTLPKLMSMLGLLTLSDVERANMNMVIMALRNTARASTNFQRRDKKFSGADWKWVQMHTYIDNPYAGVEDEERVEQTDSYIPARVYRNAAAKKASGCILRLQKVCYNKQYEDGMIHNKTKATILAALQYPMEKEGYLDYAMMRPFITVPEWIYRLKDLVQRFAGNEAIEKRHTRSSRSRTDEEEEDIENVTMLSSMLKEGWYHVLVGFEALGFVLLLSGLALFMFQKGTEPAQHELLLSVVTSVQGIYVLLYSLEMVLLVYNVGMLRVGKDVWKQLDVIMYFLVVAEFVLISMASVQSEKPGNVYPIILQVSFITLVSCRIVKTLQKRVVLFVWVWDLLDGILNRKLFYAYDLSWAYITAEDEAMAKVFRFVTQPNLAVAIRENSGYNKLQTLKNVVDIQQRYPNIEVATKTRQAARRILNKALDGLKELHEGGLLDDKQFGLLFGNLSWMIQRADGMPTNVVVGNAAFNTMLSVPWLTHDVVPRLLKSFYQYLKEGELLVEKNNMHDCVFIICSGIVRVSGCNEEPWANPVHLANSDSTHFYFCEGAFQDYLVAPDTLGLLGFLTATPSVCQCVCETDVEMCCIPMEEMTLLVEQNPEAPSLVYRMWFSVAIRVGLAVLVNQKRYQEWTHDKLKRFLENGIMPNLYYAIDFTLDEAVLDVILIQGVVQCPKTMEIYTGPTYIPNSVREMTLPGNPSGRARPIMLITTVMRYHLPSDLDWFHQPLTHYDYRKQRAYSLAATRPS
ncbi:sodium/hydrogen exchanger 10 [Rhipicephalus sanguineus]|uniref:sodium/hydrogen exchanger 10 n=1 Tax=Rhipicephalus sanguineus TaxID=34632 RepID=UPI00189512F8|nr:sodium/hydrogen exchanger 10 [Rhipicephalus sanguineus]